MKKQYTFNCLLMILFLFSTELYSQNADTTKEKPVQYRRGIELQPSHQSYEEKYFGKNLTEEKRRLFPLESTGVWTELNPNVPRVDYIGVDFINPDTGWAVGLWGAAIKTTNGGQNWTTLETATGEILLKVHSYNGEVVIAVGHNGTILRSSDGGESFTQLTGITTQELWGVRMLNDTLGWICGRNQTLLKTTDAGLTWQSISTGFNYHYWQFDFYTEDYFMIACSQGKVLKTTDGGESFTISQAGNTEDLFTIDIIDSLHIASAGSFGKNVYSSDGGIMWTANQYTALSINWIQYINRDTGYITIESAQLRKTTNRGQDWFGPGFNGAGEWQFELLDETLGYGVGAGLTVTKTEDRFLTGRNLFLNKNWSDVFFINEMKGFLTSAALGEKVYKTEDGGNTYQIIENSPEWNYDILFLDSLTGFLGTNSIYKTIDGGENWYATIGAGQATKIFFINPLTGWAIGSNVIYKTIDGGENWVVQFTHISDSFTSIFFIDSLNGWATSRYVHQTTDGGVNWIERMDIQLYFTREIYFTDIDTGFVTEGFTGNDLYKTSDGGLNWQRDTRIETAFYFNYFPDKYHWILNGGVGQLWETTNNGNSWMEISGNIPSSGFSRFHAPREWIGYAVGAAGLILKYEDTSYVPVELISFEVSIVNKKVILYWQTVSELNNNGFQIEKSYDKEKWSNIGFVEGRGTTTDINYYSFTDNEIPSAIQFYRLKQIDYDGSFEYSKIIEINTDIIISSFRLFQNYPNPFNSSTTIRYQIATDEFVSLKIYDVLGNEIKTLINEDKKAGYYNFDFSVNDLSSGIYFYKLTAGEYNQTKKFILLK